MSVSISEKSFAQSHELIMIVEAMINYSVLR